MPSAFYKQRCWLHGLSTTFCSSDAERLVLGEKNFSFSRWPSDRTREGVDQAQSAGRLGSGDLKRAAVVSQGVQSNSSQKTGVTMAAGDSTCSRGGCNLCPELHMDQCQDTLQRASCFLLEAMAQNQRCLRPGTAGLSRWKRRLCGSDTSCPVLSEVAALWFQVQGQRGKAA